MSGSPARPTTDRSPRRRDELYNPRLRVAYRIDADGILVMLADETRAVDEAQHKAILAGAGAVTRIDIVDELEWRGLIAASTDLDELRKHLDAGMVTLYAGFDPTAASLVRGSSCRC